MRDMKSLVTYIFHKKFGNQGSNMKYTQFDGEDYSEKNLSAPFVDITEEEKLNCDLKILSSDSSGSCDSSSLNGLNLDVCDKGDTFYNLATNLSVTSSAESLDPAEIPKDEIPLKLVVTYHFSFDTEESVENRDNHKKECNNEAESQSDEGYDGNDYGSDTDDVFEDGSLDSDNEDELLEYSSVKNGSKNNLLDDCYGLDRCYSVKNVCLVDYDSDTVSNDSERDLDSETNTNDNEKTNVSNTADSIGKTENVIKYCGNPSTPTIRKNFIYYSSALKLYSGELRYEDCYPQKKFKFARKIFKKVFPSRKYVVNN